SANIVHYLRQEEPQSQPFLFLRWLPPGKRKTRLLNFEFPYFAIDCFSIKHRLDLLQSKRFLYNVIYRFSISYQNQQEYSRIDDNQG
ncbi:hypothetical protein PRIPAC_77471, partial [Pristionchus pacificus]